MNQRREDVRALHVAVTKRELPRTKAGVHKGGKGECSQVVMRAEHVRRDRRREVVPELVLVRAVAPHASAIALSGAQVRTRRRARDAPVLDVDEALRVRVAEVGLVREAEVELGLVERVLDLVGVDARREAGDDLFALELVRCVQHVVVDQDVVAEEVELG